MNKMVKVSLAGLAAAAMIIPASANTTWYGRANYEIQSANDGEYITGNSVSSRLGIRGSQDLDSGLKAIFMLESSVETAAGNGGGAKGNFNGRQAWVGLQGDFGTVSFGHQTTAFQSMLGNLNNWVLANKDVSFSGNMEGAFDDGRTNRTIKYAGKADDLTYAISFSKEVDTVEEDTKFAPSVAVGFKGVENLDLRLGYVSADDGDFTQLALTAVYKMGDLTVGFGYDTQDFDGYKVNTILIPVEFNLGGGLSANAALVRWDEDGDDDGININVGVKKNLGQRTWLYASVAMFDEGDGSRPDATDWGFGIRHDF
ncbi:porin Gram-negative type [Desulfurispirillum indicum S5]|uniref:Porin Gram-negative type n=1 Tax=Desulfurispirillum indicum (strain ATCC BAA-1389 / DSM 22839 / S5) TaxID=653733 RepID=E6W0L5_DESIS|nr:porin [Desulfurispirillum indicum]ADU65267.1 porin Gram-negative type [Desulfurispirillum indicum S5]